MSKIFSASRSRVLYGYPPDISYEFVCMFIGLFDLFILFMVLFCLEIKVVNSVLGSRTGSRTGSGFWFWVLGSVPFQFRT